MYQGEIGVGIISFNRYSYLMRLLQSLEKNTHLENIDFHLFQDGAVNRFSRRRLANQVNINRSIQTFRKSNIPSKKEHIRKDNVGCGIQHFEAYERMFKRYKYAVILENDIIVSPYYFRLVRILIDQLKNRNDIFSFSLGYQRVCPINKIKENLNKIIICRPHWWAEAIFSARWKKVRPHFLEYYRFIGRIDYSRRPHGQIRQFFKKKGWPGLATGQDGAMDMASRAAKLARAMTIVNRAIYIGQKGIHSTPALYQRGKYLSNRPFTFEEDATIEKFEWPKK